MSKLFKSVFVALLVLIVIGVGPAVKADNAPATSQGPSKLGVLFAQVGLTDAQREQIKTAMADAKDKAEALNDDTSLTDDQLKAKRQQIRIASIQTIFAVLTDDQLAKFTDIRFADATWTSPADSSLDYLNLTDAQKDQVSKIKSAAETQIAAAKANTSLTADQVSDKTSSIRQDAIKQVFQLTTPDQKKVWIVHIVKGNTQGDKPAGQQGG